MDAAQLVFPGYTFGLDDPKTAEQLVDLGVGGFCLYGGAAPEVAEFTARLQRRAKIPLLFCADYEDGVASQSEGGTHLPTNMAVAAAGQEALAMQKAVVTAVEARAVGVRWVLAPVVDLATCADNPIVNVRAFSDEAAAAVRLARAYLRGLAFEKVLSCLKHYPGHGETTADSHLTLPSVKVDRETLEARELVPYRELAAEADSVMTAHLLVPALEKDPALPISLSREPVEGLLRGKLGFKGLVSTDALNMHAIAKNFPEEKAARLALEGGADVLLVPVDPRKTAYWILEAAKTEPVASLVRRALERLKAAKEKARLGVDGGRVSEEELSRVGCKGHQEVAASIASAAAAWARGGPGGPAREVFYMEPDADTPDEWQGQDFVASLREAGVEIASSPEGKPLVAGLFLRPHAYSGRIQLEPELLERCRAARAKAASGLAVSFGNPFLVRQLPELESALCAFSADEHSQRAAAAVVAGRAPARGRMPVAL